MSHARRGRSSPTEKFLPGWVLELTIGHIREPLSLSLFSESVEIEEVCDVVLERYVGWETGKKASGVGGLSNGLPVQCALCRAFQKFQAVCRAPSPAC